jgi:hypothetical protein
METSLSDIENSENSARLAGTVAILASTLLQRACQIGSAVKCNLKNEFRELGFEVCAIFVPLRPIRFSNRAELIADYTERTVL